MDFVAAAVEALKAKKTVTLNEDKFVAERKELNADKEEEEIYEGLSDPNRPVFRLDDYDKEALEVLRWATELAGRT